MIIDSLAAAGAERVVVTLSEAFYKQGHQVDIILWNNIIEYQINPNINIHVLEKKTAQELKKLITEINNLNNGAFDYIYSHLHGKIKIVKQAKLKNIYYVFHIPISHRFKSKNNVIKWLKKKKLQMRYRNENLITVSDGIKDDLIENKIKANSINSIYNPFEFESIKQQANQEENDIPKDEYIINVARFHFQKRQDILLKAFKQSNLNCKLLLVGKGSKEEYQKIENLINELELQEKVIIVGFNSNPYPLIKNAKLLVLSSDFEGLPMVLIEALILNTPIVSTNCKSGPSEIMKDNLANYLVSTGDVDSLALKMYDAYHNPPLINQNDLKRFDADIISKKYLSLKENN